MLSARRVPEDDNDPGEGGEFLESVLQHPGGPGTPVSRTISPNKHKATPLLDGRAQYQQQPPRLVNRVPIHKLNARVRGKPRFFKLRNLWHTLTQLVWWKLFLGITLVWFMFHLFFGLLFFFEAGANMKSVQNLHEEGDSLLWVFWKCVFFSVQTGQTIGYGWWAPLTPYSNTVVLADSFTIMVFQIIFTGLMVAKLARPSLLARRVMFSDVAVISRSAEYYRGGADTLDTGKYVADGRIPSLQFRVLNGGKTMLCSAQFRLLLLRQLPAPQLPTAMPSISRTPSPSRSPSPAPPGTSAEHRSPSPQQQQQALPMPPLADSSAAFYWKFDELNFELNSMRGRVRGAAMSTPLLPLPWTISHAIDEWSPLFGLSPEDLERSHAEIIAIVDGVDEGCSNNVQSRWSYLPSEVRWGAVFEPCVEVRGGQFLINADRLSSWHWEHFDEAGASASVPTVVAASTPHSSSPAIPSPSDALLPHPQPSVFVVAPTASAAQAMTDFDESESGQAAHGASMDGRSL